MNSFYRLLDVFEEIIHILQTYAEADGGVFYIHRLTHILGKCTEDGACRMDGERTVVEEIGGTMDVKDTTIRLSVGLEDMDDLFEDIKQAVGSL